jgi:hypothetical protein
MMQSPGISCRGNAESRLIVGWAKRSVPTIQDDAVATTVGTALARLCPPYDSSRCRV